jgi:type VI protein secretion system component VasK
MQPPPAMPASRGLPIAAELCMENPLNTVSDLPKPVQILLLVGSGAGLATVFMAISTNDKAWKIAAAGLIAVGLVMVLFKLVLILWDKRKSGPFSQMIARTASGRGASDPAQKARMDDLRKKFEEGVLAFKAAGKDLYSLPWYMVVGRRRRWSRRSPLKRPC